MNKPFTKKKKKRKIDRLARGETLLESLRVLLLESVLQSLKSKQSIGGKLLTVSSGSMLSYKSRSLIKKTSLVLVRRTFFLPVAVTLWGTVTETKLYTVLKYYSIHTGGVLFF